MEYIITIVGTQTVEGEDDRIEVITTGQYEEKDGKKIIRYTEYNAEDPALKTDTVVTVESERSLTIDRAGAAVSRLILEEGRRHQCHYDTPMGAMLIGVYTSSIRDTLTKDGGDVRAVYDLDFFSDIVSKNEFHINIKVKESEEHVKD